MNSVIYFYSFFLFCVITAQGAVTISSMAVSGKVNPIVEVNMMKSIAKYSGDASSRKLWDKTQESLQCCGVYNATDWLDLNLIQSEHKNIPDSCKIADFHVNITKDKNSPEIHSQGCLVLVTSRISEEMFIITASCIAFIVLELLGIAVISSQN